MNVNRRNALLILGGSAGAVATSAVAVGTLAKSGVPVGTVETSVIPVGAVADNSIGDEYQLPPLPYAYNALEPHIDEATLRLHHDKHHAGYVKGLNAALAKIKKARESGDYGLIQHYERLVAFHGSGHINHVLYWENMSPNGGGQPLSLIHI